MQNRKKPTGNVFGSNARHQEKRQIAMGIMVEEAMKGDMEALKDLLSILTPSDDWQGLLTKIFTSAHITEEQRDLISWRSRLFSGFNFKFNKGIALDLAKDGDVEALKYLLDFLDSESARLTTVDFRVEIIKEEAKPRKADEVKDVWADEEISTLLFDILLSGFATSEQKDLIRAHKDTIILIRNYSIDYGSRDPNDEEEDIDWSRIHAITYLLVNVPPPSPNLVVVQQQRYSIYDCIRLGLSPKRMW